MSLRSAVLPALIVLTVAVPSHALRFYVDGASGAGDNRRSVMVAQDPDTPWRTITHALRIAHLIPEGRPHIIQIAAGTYSPATESFPLRISQTDIYLESGGNVIFDAQFTAGILAITAPTQDFLLQSMSFVNGLAERGGMVYCQTCSLRVVDSRIIGNRSTLGGDVIYQEGGRLKFNNNVVRYNGAPGGDTPLIDIHNTFADTFQRDVIRNNTFYLNETPAILTSGNRTDISSNIFSGTAGSGVPAIVDSAAVGPLVRYNLFWDTDILLIEGQDSIKVERVIRDTTTLEELGVQVPDFVTNEPDTVAQVESLYEYDIEVEGNKPFYRFTPLTLPAGVSTDLLKNDGIIRWTPAEADTGRHEIRVEIITSSGGLGYLTYNVRVYTPESFPDTTSQGPQVTVTFVPDTTGAIDSLNLADPVFSSAASAGDNLYGDPLFLNTTISRFEILAGSPGRDAGNPVIALWDPLQGGRIRRNDIGHTGGPINSGLPAIGTHNELTLQALPDSVATEGVPWTYDPTVLEGGTFYVADVIRDTTLPRIPMLPPPTLTSVFGAGKKPPFTWTPTLADTGTYLIGIHVYTSANTGSGGRHFFELRVRPENEPPTISSTPPTQAFEDSLLTYAISAADPNGDDITYSVLAGPEGLTVDADGTVRWLPAQADIGTVEMQIAATDPKGAARVQTFTLTVVNTNDAPTLAAVGDTLVIEDALLELTLEAADADSVDTLSWAVADGPDSASIDSAGIFRWTPLQADVGVNEITVQVSDLAGATATTTFAVTVVEVDEPPFISTEPDTVAFEDSLYTYQVGAGDEEGSIASYTLAAAPEGMAIDTAGVVTWTPVAAHVGDHPVEIAVADSAGQQVSQTYTLTVAAVNDAPVIEARTPADALVVVEPGVVLELSVTASDEEGAALTYQWLVNGVTQDSTGASLSLVPDTAAVDTVVVRVLDGVDTTSTQWLVDGRAIPRLVVSQDSVAFGQVGLGDTAAVVLTIENLGYSDLEISNLQVGNLQFSAVFGSSTVAGRGSAELQLRFAPTSRGARSSTIQFSTDDPENATVSIGVSGTGVLPTVLSLDLDGAAGDQGAITASVSAGDSLTVDVYATRSLELTGYTLLVAFDPALARFGAFDLRGPEAANLLEEGGNSLIPAVTAPADSLVRVTVSTQAGAQGVSADGILGRLTFVTDSAVVTLSELELRLVRAELTGAGQSTPDTVTAQPATVSVGPTLVGDFDGNGVVDFDDFFLFADHFGGTDPLYDLDGSGGRVNFDDFFVFVDHFGDALARAVSLPRGEALEGLAWHPRGEAGEVGLDLVWNGRHRLRGLVLGVEYDAARLRFTEYRHRGEGAPLTWVVEDRPGWLLLALGVASGQADMSGLLGEVAFERLSPDDVTIRPLQALGHMAVGGDSRSMPLALPRLATVAALPTSHALHPAFPNPFNPETVLSFSLGSQAHVSLRIYDLLGREVAAVLDEVRPRGQHRVAWRARSQQGHPLAAGLYLAELRVGSYRQVRKLMLIK